MTESGDLSAAELRAELTRFEREERGLLGAAGPLEDGVMHLWPLPGPPQMFSAPLERHRPGPTYTSDVTVPREADADIASAISTRHTPGVYAEKMALLSELDDKWAFKALDQQSDLSAADCEQRAAWQHAVQDLFAAESSDDSDGVDPDYDREWRAETTPIFAACRALHNEPDNEQVVDAFVTMLSETRDLEVTVTERHMVWDALRWAYREAEAVHDKQWLSQCSRLADGGAFAHRPSLTAFLHIASAAVAWPPLGERHRRKAQRWAGRTMVLFHKRVAALREFGAAEPTWAQVHVAPCARPETIPSALLHHAVKRAATQRHAPGVKGAPDEAPPIAVTEGCCSHGHFPCDKSPAKPHYPPPDR
eukprot:TRINITY_DN13867_c0_g1_i1.p1 TRINITY_DN13867_c0_g1~~TRINITY_DN13867_c0_g1_i1.p1  ORF type:complete len:364 (+),score=113.90 TRINITY_DN13867_c0_g1_i1:72-1163(+)